MKTRFNLLTVVKGLIILIRPDQYIGLIADEATPGLLDAYFKSF